MKVITVKQPFATLIASGLKEYEFRTWKTNYRGEIYIHAGLNFNQNEIKKYEKYNLHYEKGAIIAKANLIDCIKVDANFREYLKKKNYLVYENIINDKNWQGYAFKLENIEEVIPIPIKGRLSLWEYDQK